MNDKAKTYDPGAEIINPGEHSEIEYWSVKLSVKAEQLKTAIKAVGNSVPEIKKYLNIR